jgi:hypothetical protein
MKTRENFVQRKQRVFYKGCDITRSIIIASLQWICLHENIMQDEKVIAEKLDKKMHLLLEPGNKGFSGRTTFDF